MKDNRQRQRYPRENVEIRHLLPLRFVVRENGGMGWGGGLFLLKPELNVYVETIKTLKLKREMIKTQNQNQVNIRY